MGLFDDLIPADAPAQPPGSTGLFDDLIPNSAAPEAGPPAPGKGQPQNVPPQSFTGRVADTFTGASRTEFPDALEFGPALMRGGVRPEEMEQLGGFDLSGVGRSAITPDPNAQLDILKRNIPGLESRTDAYGNVMLRAPQFGVSDWAYLNKPGVSGRDVDELATQTLATLPFLGVAGAGASTLPRAALQGGTALAAGELAKDALAKVAGSEQGFDPVRAGIAAGFGAVTAPGVPSAIASTAGDLAAMPFRGPLNALRALRNPELEASRRVGTALARDDATQAAATAAGRPTRNLTDAEAQMAERTGQPVTTMDTGGETTRALARSSANVSTEARSTLQDTIDPRFETQAERASLFLEGLVGAPANAHAVREALEQARPPTLGPIYDAAYLHGRAGVHTPELAALEAHPALQTARARADRMLEAKDAAGTLQTGATGSTGMPTLEYWDQVQRALRDQVSSLRISGAREHARDVGELRGRLLAELDATFPFYSHARTSAARFFGAETALEAGEMFAMQRFGLDVARRDIGRMSPQERLMFQQGYASRLIERLNEANDRRSIITQVVGSPAALERLEIALGVNGAREMEAFMRIESVMDMARSAVQGNSTTVRQLAELGLGTTGAGLTYYDPTNPHGAAAIVGAALMYGARRGDQRVAQRIAERLVSQDPAVRQQALAQVANSGATMRALRRFDQALSGPGRGVAMQQGASAAAPERQPQPEAINAMADAAGPPVQSRDVRAPERAEAPESTNAMATEQGSLGKGAPFRDSDNVEDRRPAPKFRGQSDDDLIERYNEIGQLPRTEENLERLRELLYEFERRGAMQLKRPPEQPDQRPIENGGELVPLPPAASPQPLNAMGGTVNQNQNAMAGSAQSGSIENPIPVRTRADVERAPSGAYVVDEAGKISRRN